MLVVVAVALFGWWLMAPPDKMPDDPVKIGLVMPLSGELADLGENVRHGLDIAFEESGFSSEKIRLIYEDTGGFTPAAAVTSFTKITKQDHADIIIGPLGPAQTLSVAPTLDTSGLAAAIAVSTCDDRFTEYPILFCIYPGLREQVRHEVDFMKRMSWKNVYFFTEQSELGLQAETLLKEYADEITIVGVEKVVSGTTKDFRTQIAKAVATKPDVVFAMFAAPEGAVMLRQYAPLGKDIPLYIGTDVNNDGLRDIFGTEAPGVYFGALLSSEYDPAFIAKYEERYGIEPDYLAALAHSSATLLFDLLKESDFRMEDIVTELVGRTGNTAVHSFRFNQDRSVSVPLLTYQFKDGKLAPYGE